MDQRSGDGWFIGGIEVLAIRFWKDGKNFPNFEMLDAKIAFALNKIIQDFTVQEEGQSRGTEKAQKEDRFLRGRQIAFMIYDYFRATGAHDTVLDYADLFSATFHDDNNQEFETRWDEVLFSMSKIPSDDVLEIVYKLRIRESHQHKKAVLKLYDMSPRNSKTLMPNYQKWTTTVKEESRSETSITKL